MDTNSNQSKPQRELSKSLYTPNLLNALHNALQVSLSEFSQRNVSEGVIGTTVTVETITTDGEVINVPFGIILSVGPYTVLLADMLKELRESLGLQPGKLESLNEQHKLLNMPVKGKPI